MAGDSPTTTSPAAAPPPETISLSISGGALAALLHGAAVSAADSDGLLFGHVTTTTSSPSLSDESTTPASSAPNTSLSISISGHSSLSSPSSFSDPLGSLLRSRFHLLAGAAGSRVVIGWFSSRRRSPLRPSMRELAVTKTLALRLTANPCVFLLISSSASPNLAVHSLEYRAYLLAGGGPRLEARPLRVANVGPGFREQYGTFAAESPMPWLSCRGAGDSGEHRDSIGSVKRAAKDQEKLDGLVEGFKIERLERMVGMRGGGGAAAGAGVEMEELYGGMLRRLEGLARQVEKSAAKVLEQENRNLSMRSKLAGL